MYRGTYILLQHYPEVLLCSPIPDTVLMRKAVGFFPLPKITRKKITCLSVRWKIIQRQRFPGCQLSQFYPVNEIPVKRIVSSHNLPLADWV